MAPPPLGILFDKDGTLVDFDRTWGRAGLPAMERLARGDAGAVERLAAAMHYSPAERRFAPTSPIIASAPDAYAHLWAEALGRDDRDAVLAEMNDAFAAETLRALCPLGDPAAVCARLRARGHRLGLATNDGAASARAQLGALGLDGHMDFVAGYDSGHGGKPGPGMVLAFAQALGLPPARVLMVGDSAHDLLAARAAGAVAVAVLSGPATRDALAPLADHVIDGIANLPALADRLAGRSA